MRDELYKSLLMVWAVFASQVLSGSMERAWFSLVLMSVSALDMEQLLSWRRATIRPTSGGRKVLGRKPGLRKNAPMVYVASAAGEAHLRDALLNHLQPQEHAGSCGIFDDQVLPIGASMETSMFDRLEEAAIVVFLLSAEYLASPLNQRIVARALSRARAGELRLIPVAARAVDLQLSPFAGLAALPRDGRSLATHPQRDEQIAAIAKEIMEVAAESRG